MRTSDKLVQLKDETIAELQRKDTVNQELIAQLTEQVEELKKANFGLTYSNQKLVYESGALRVTIKELNSQLNVMEGENNSLREKVVSLEEGNIHLTKQLVQCKQSGKE